MTTFAQHLVCIEYPEYKPAVWSTDLALFHVPPTVSGSQLIEEIEFQRENMNADDYDSLLELSEDLLDSVARHFCGDWQWMPTVGTVRIYEE